MYLGQNKYSFLELKKSCSHFAYSHGLCHITRVKKKYYVLTLSFSQNGPQNRRGCSQNQTVSLETDIATGDGHISQTLFTA